MMPLHRSQIIVSNTSPIYYAARIGQLDLLRQLYAIVLIPEQVYMELLQGTIGLAANVSLRSASWLQPRKVRNTRFVAELQKELDAGEAEAIALCKEIHADLLLMDEERGRKIATREGIERTGIVGILLAAKKERLITEIRPSLNALFQETNFYGSAELYQQALELAGE